MTLVLTLLHSFYTSSTLMSSLSVCPACPPARPAVTSLPAWRPLTAAVETPRLPITASVPGSSLRPRAPRGNSCCRCTSQLERSRARRPFECVALDMCPNYRVTKGIFQNNSLLPILFLAKFYFNMKKFRTLRILHYFEEPPFRLI